MSVRPCGDCSLCCKLLRIQELDKPVGRWCAHFCKGTGCAIHDRAPAECRSFQCGWTLETSLPEAWRPDRCKMVLSTNAGGRLIVDVDPAFPGAWRKEPYYSKLKAWSDRRGPNPLQVVVRTGERYVVLFPEIDIDLGPCGPGEVRILSGYRQEGVLSVPFAELLPAGAI